MNEREVTARWRELFLGQSITPELLKKADALIDRLGAESPLRVRWTKELEDIRKLSGNVKTAPKIARKRQKSA
jgi:hypothetical protein